MYPTIVKTRTHNRQMLNQRTVLKTVAMIFVVSAVAVLVYVVMGV